MSPPVFKTSAASIQREFRDRGIPAAFGEVAQPKAVQGQVAEVLRFPSLA